MINKKCKHYPCHESIEQCKTCYCPFYPCEYPYSEGYYLENKVWACDKCEWIHRKDVLKEIKFFFKTFHKMIEEVKDNKKDLYRLFIVWFYNKKRN